MSHASLSSTGLSSRTAGALCYLGWWVTGLIFWALERSDPFVRFHAAQATIVFGALAGVILLLVVAAVLALTFVPEAFTPLLTAAGVVWALGVGVWGVALWRAARGDVWRLPWGGAIAERLAGSPDSEKAGSPPAFP